MKRFTSKSTVSNTKSLFDSKWSVGRVKIENAFGILKYKFLILNNLNADLKYASTIVTACCILHNFLIDEGDSSESDILDKELNSLLPLGPRLWWRLKTIAKDQREILCQNWMRNKYKTESAPQAQKERFQKFDTI